MTTTALDLEALADTLDRAAAELRLAAEEKRKRGTRGPSPLRIVEEANISDLDQAAARAALEKLRKRKASP